MSLSSYFLYMQDTIDNEEDCHEALGSCAQQISLAVSAFFCGMRNSSNRDMADLYFRSPPYSKTRSIKQTCVMNINRLFEEGVCTDNMMQTLLASSAYPVTRSTSGTTPMSPTGMKWEMFPMHLALHTAVINCVCNPDPGFIAISPNPDKDDIHLSLRLVTGPLLPLIVFSPVLQRLVLINVQVHDNYEEAPPIFHDDRCVVDLVDHPTILGITPTH